MHTHLLTIAALFIAVSAPQITAADLAAHLERRPKAYSVDMTMTNDGKTTKIHQSIDGDHFRIESSAGGRTSVSILNRTERKMVVLVTANKMAMEMPLSEELAKKINQDPSEEMKGKANPAGSETIKGIVCDKFETVSEAGQKGTLWMNQQDHTMVRWTSESTKQTVDYDNYKIGPQPAELFVIPAGFQKMAMPAPPASPTPKSAP